MFEHVVIEQLKCVKCCGCVRFQLSTHGLFSVARAISSCHRCFFWFRAAPFRHPSSSDNKGISGDTSYSCCCLVGVWSLHCRGEEDSVIGWPASKMGGGHVLRRMAVFTFAAVMREHGGSVGRLLAHIRRLEAADCGSPGRHWGLRGCQGSGNEGQSHQQASQKDYAERNEVS